MLRVVALAGRSLKLLTNADAFDAKEISLFNKSG
jgi:hypothetical protein